MQINDEDLKDFKKRYAEVFGNELSHAEASEAANDLAELYLFLSKPLPSEQAIPPKPSGETDSRIPS